MLLAAILAVGGWAFLHGLRHGGLRRARSRLRGLLLDVHLIRPICVIRFGKAVLQRAQLLDRFLGPRRIAAAGRADRTAEPGIASACAKGVFGMASAAASAQAARSNT